MGALTGAELLRAYVLTGFPWATPVQAFVSTVAGQGLAWFGPHGLMLLLLLLAWGLWQSRPLQIAAALLCVLALWPADPGPPATTGKIVRIIQPNAVQDRKWHPGWSEVFFARQLQLTRAPAARQPDLIVWPETAVPWMLDHAEDQLRQIALAARGTPVALGMLRSQGFRYFNALVVLDGQGRVADIYDKHHLVPFTEFIPLGWLTNSFGLNGFASDIGFGFAAGDGPALLDLGPLGRAVPLICYEAVFAHDVNGGPGRGDFIMQVTNDAWFGRFAGPQQHLAIARMRAIEQGLPLLRAANTGISAMIGPRGQVLHRLDLGQAGRIDAALPQALPPTIYVQIGDGPIVLLLLLWGAGAVLRRRGAAISN